MFVLWFRETDFCRNYCFFVIKILFTNDLRARVQSCFTCFRPFEILWTVASQAPLSIGFSKQEHWSGLPFPPPGIFLTQGSYPGLLHCRQILPSEPPVQPNSLRACVQFLWERLPSSCGENVVESFGFPGGSDGKESACNAGDMSLIPGLGRSPGEGSGNPLQYSCLENSMDGSA